MATGKNKSCCTHDVHDHRSLLSLAGGVGTSPEGKTLGNPEEPVICITIKRFKIPLTLDFSPSVFVGFFIGLMKFHKNAQF